MALSPRLQRFLWTGLLLAAGVVIAVQGIRLLEAIQAGVVTSSDFCPDYDTARHWLSGAPIYTPTLCWSRFSSTPQPVEYDSHPPSSLLLLAPFALFSYGLASWLWGLFSLACLLLSLLIICRELGLWSLRSVVPILALFLLWEPTMESTRAGNIGGGIICLMVALTWRALRRNQQLQAGTLAGLAIAFKVLPILLLPLFLLRRQWRALYSSVAALLLSVLVSLALMGPRAWLDYLGPVRVNENPAVAVPGNLSLEGLVARWLAGYHEFLHPGASRAFIDLAPLVSGFSLQTALLLGDGLAALIIALTSIWLWKRRAEPRWGEQDDAGFAFILTLTFLVFPRAWQWGLVLLAMPLLWLAVKLVRQPSSKARWPGGLAAILLAVPFSLITPAFQAQQQTSLPWLVRLGALLLTTIPTIGVILLLLALWPSLTTQTAQLASQQVPGEFLTAWSGPTRHRSSLGKWLYRCAPFLPW
ncbi:MAG TPA: glycosyltransferase family 87 protein [Ktedonobacterales bacterium]|nr:glycosyltransferase family 87 protein [Ktedonobacterales bacterium]